MNPATPVTTDVCQATSPVVNIVTTQNAAMSNPTAATQGEDQEVGSSNLPSCTNEINGLAEV
jgi:hypothetical protein